MNRVLEIQREKEKNFERERERERVQSLFSDQVKSRQLNLHGLIVVPLFVYVNFEWNIF